MFTICLVLAAAVLLLLFLLYVLLGAHEEVVTDLRGRLAEAERKHARTTSLLDAVEDELAATKTGPRLVGRFEVGPISAGSAR